ncbi:T9SS type A sorting domain-containing protein [Hymenobacter monticola]|uniref:T9SS type A sorting domain-containing protein n=1 Tax=Hymenobacter monticola TaxID=1705399 RepID=A0ABY4BCM6_9BACT|nr:T9SS type A sorting domain-containing protein [Hymenobacter monticola]UOE36062.1 T9SS type A sorting domain-containing protein [Hymenobacter monticola]
MLQQPLTAVVGSPSPATGTVLVSGSSLTGNITVAAPAGFEVALASVGTYAATQSLTPQSGGFVSNASVLFRLTGAAVGTFSGNISLSSAGTTTVDVPVTGLVAATTNLPATLTGVSPATGMPGTTVVNFYGRNFVPGATASIYNNGPFTIGPTTYVSSTQLTAPITTSGVNAPISSYCGVSNPGPGGGGTTLPGVVMFTAVPGPPTVTGFSPTIGPVGTLVTIRGVGFIAQGQNAVYFNGTLAQLQYTPSNNELTVRVPAGATTGPITVTTTGGTATSSTPFVVPPVFFEDFETGTKTSYVPASVLLFTMGWTLGEALIGTTAGVDKFNGLKSARLRGGGFVEMDVDKPNGAGVVTVSAASYATESGASFIPEISTDGGVTYTSLLGSSPAPTLTGTLTPYSFTANRTGNVRLRFSSTNTAAATNPRINIDDIGITDYRVGTATRPGQQLPDVSVFPNPTQGRVLVQGAGAGPVRCSLHDLAGRQLTVPVSLPTDGKLDLPAGLPAGLYLLQVETPSGRRTLRLATR